MMKKLISFCDSHKLLFSISPCPEGGINIVLTSVGKVFDVINVSDELIEYTTDEYFDSVIWEAIYAKYEKITGLKLIKR